MYENHEILLYDLANRPASFDFVTCMSTAISYGVKHVRFVMGGWKKKNYTEEQARERFKSIIEPAVWLYGLTYSIGEPAGIEYSHFFNKCIKAYNENGRIGMIPIACVPKDYITITLRNSRNPDRNSKEEEWKKFATRIPMKAIIIKDYEDRPLALSDRMKLYAGARMNLMTINGPLTLCIHSDAPYISMRTIGNENSGSTSPEHMERLGITGGFQFPWAKPHQHLSYLDDTCENIEAEFESVLGVERLAA